MPTKHLIIGKIGEKMAFNYLKRQKYAILAVNWKVKLGEIDIVARDFGSNNSFDDYKEVFLDLPDDLNDKNNLNDNLYDKISKCHIFLSYILSYIMSFIFEGWYHTKSLFDKFVKLYDYKKSTLVFVEVKTILKDKDSIGLEPEANLTYFKKEKFFKTAKYYLLKHKLPLDINWRLDLIAIILDVNQDKVALRHYKNIIDFY